MKDELYLKILTCGRFRIIFGGRFSKKYFEKNTYYSCTKIHIYLLRRASHLPHPNPHPWLLTSNLLTYLDTLLKVHLLIVNEEILLTNKRRYILYAWPIDVQNPNSWWMRIEWNKVLHENLITFLDWHNVVKPLSWI